MKCQICEYSVSRQNIYNKEGFYKKYNFCIHCGQKFENIIQSKLSDFIEKLSLQKEKKQTVVGANLNSYYKTQIM